MTWRTIVKTSRDMPIRSIELVSLERNVAG
jgi:hypothetical protein